MPGIFAGGVGLTTLPLSCRECLEIWNQLGLSRPAIGLFLPFLNFHLFKVQAFRKKNWTTYALKKEPAYFAETSVTNYQYLKRNIPEERKFSATELRKPEILHIIFFYYAVNCHNLYGF